MNYKNLVIEWLGHAGFLIKTDKIIYIDPFQISNGEKADIIFITHDHYDHCSLQDIEKIVKDGTIIVCPSDCQSKITKLKQEIDIQVLNPGNAAAIKGIKVRAFPAYNVDKEFHKKEDDWNSYVMEINSVKIYHAGDTDLIPEMKTLGEIDIALLPVGGKFTMDAEEASKAAEVIKPKLAIPMHYASIIGTKQDAEKFVQLCQANGIKAGILEKNETEFVSRK
ncbi:MAG: MBL fold metallo-hydrolase [Candidatus Pacearchaeota archaeon]